MMLIRNTLILVVCLIAYDLALGQKVERLFYIVDNEKCFESFTANIGSIDIVGPQAYKFDAHGILWGTVDKRILDLASRHQVKVMPLLVNAGFDQPAFHSLLTDSTARARAIAGMLRVCRENKFYGLQFDFENIHIRDRDLYTEFYRQAAKALHAAGFAISIAVVPRVGDIIGPTEYHKWIYEYWRGAYDYKALGEIGDFISLMTYDQHTYRTTPGPVAGFRWMEAVIRFVLPQVPASKISLGIPFYSYRWQPSYQNNQPHVWGRCLDYLEARGLADRFGSPWHWDEQDKVSFTYYPNDYINEFLFLEDARSFAAKFELVKKYGFRGISVWRLGHEDPKVWEKIGSSTR